MLITVESIYYQLTKLISACYVIVTITSYFGHYSNFGEKFSSIYYGYLFKNKNNSSISMG